VIKNSNSNNTFDGWKVVKSGKQIDLFKIILIGGSGILARATFFHTSYDWGTIEFERTLEELFPAQIVSKIKEGKGVIVAGARF
jgi:hypothetical protein